MTRLYVKRAKPETLRRVTITQHPEWRTGLRAVGKGVATGTYQGEILNFASAVELSKQLTQKRLELVRLAQGKGAIPVRELARLAQRDVKRVHRDAMVLAALKLLERSDTGGVLCPFESIRLDATAAACIAGQPVSTGDFHAEASHSPEKGSGTSPPCSPEESTL
jgi:predicted transcriptional regulator